MNERPEAAPLFDAAAREARRAWGPHIPVQSIAIVAAGGLELRCSIPAGWVVSDDDEPKVKNGAAIADVLATLVEVGHRLTRQGLCDAMQEKNRSRAESVVGECLTTLTRLGILDNKQDKAPKGYGTADMA